MSTTVRVLLVEDSEDDAELILRELRRGGFSPEFKRVCTPDELSTVLANQGWDIVLSDYAMPRFNALEALRLVQLTGSDLPFIIVSGTIGEDVAVAAMKAGAHDYIMKDKLARLVPAMKRELREAQERHARKLAEEMVWHQAYHDPLTNLPNRNLFLDRLGQAMAYLRRSKGKLALLFVDLDGFKFINDTLGHIVGDQVLQSVAIRLSHTIREEDTLARLGGDEFALLLTRLNDAEDAAKKSQALLDSLKQPFEIGGRQLHVGASIGIAMYPNNVKDGIKLLRNADIAMYQAKAKGGNTFAFFTPDIDSASTQRFTLENNLRRALRNQEFELYYQPQINLANYSITGVEALLRWNDPEYGVLLPSQFIPIAEQTGLIVSIGQWVLEQACRDYADWIKQGIAPPRLAINLSTRHLLEGDLVSEVASCAPKKSVFEFEITESAMMMEPDRAVETVTGLKEMGAHIAIDDFGTGYSSLTYLKRFPIDTLKIDRSFIHEIINNKEDAAIVTAIIAMAHSLNINVIAEGVETEEQRTFLRQKNCEEMQGFLFSRPIPPTQLHSLMNRQVS